MKKILIVHKPYTILEPEYVKDVCDSMDGAAAYCDCANKLIVVPLKNNEGEELTNGYRLELLEHEIIHCLIYEAGYDGTGWSSDEKLVEMIRFISEYIRTTGVLGCLS